MVDTDAKVAADSERRRRKRCANESCREGMYPHYGLAPHVHVGSSFIGSTRIEPRASWPKNFTPDPDCEGAGMWTCPDCGGSGYAD